MTLDPAAMQKRPGFLRRMYDWTLRWADRPGGVWALFVLAFAESSFFPIPPDVLLIALCVGAPQKSFKFAAVCSLGSVLGGMAGYGIGFWGYDAIGEPIVKFYQGEAVMAKIQAWYNQYGFWGTLAAAVTPIPYKVFTIASGVFEFPFASFVLASAIGRSFRFFMVGSVIYIFGPKVHTFIEKYFDWLAWALLVLGVGGFLVLKYLQ